MTLESILTQMIRQEGPVSMARFMQEALSHPTYGYYQVRDPFGVAGDFITAPEVSQVFGELMGIWCAVTWQQMGSPDELILVEMGPGRGTLMKDLLRGTRHIPGFHRALSVHLIETSPHLTKMQQQELKGAHDLDITWHTTFETVPPKRMLFVANELFDALPIYQYIKTAQGWQEKHIGLAAENNALEEVILPAVPIMQVTLEKTYLDAKDGSVVELCPAGQRLIQEISNHLATHGGAALIVDYGYGEVSFRSTLQAVKSHQYHPLLKDIGQADITAHVNFGALKQYAKASGVNAYGPITQSELLSALGIETRMQMLLEKVGGIQKQELLTGIKRLIHPEQMGELFKAIALTEKTMPAPIGFDEG